MLFKRLFARKSLETLLAEMAGEHRLRRALGPISLTSLGVGAIIGAGIFVMTGRVASEDAGPAIVVSYMVAACGCAFAAFCYAEFASMAPVAGSAYTYAYATLGELFAWIIGWDLILEYAMSCACVAAGWSSYFNVFLETVFNVSIPAALLSDPFTTPGALFNLPAVIIMAVITTILVIGIRESATTNAILVVIKLAVVLFVIGIGMTFVDRSNWTTIPVTERRLPGESDIPRLSAEYVSRVDGLEGSAAKARSEQLAAWVTAQYKLEAVAADVAKQQAAGKIHEAQAKELIARAQAKYTPATAPGRKDLIAISRIAEEVRVVADREALSKWGMLGMIGLNRWLTPIDDAVRSPFAPYGFSGIMLGAAIVFFAFIGFDSISTHSEEAKVPARDVPIGIIASLVICSILYIGVSSVITGMEAYPNIDRKAAIAAAFQKQALLAEAKGKSGGLLTASAALIATGALAGMTSVLLVTFLSQSRVFLAMARDRLLPPRIFGAVHPRFQTPHISTSMTGLMVCIVAGITPIAMLEEMVNIGTLFAFVVVCASVLLLRFQRPDAHRPFRCPAVFLIAPLGIFVNLTMMLFLPWDTWLRLVVWLAIGLVIYFLYGHHHSNLGQELMAQLRREGIGPTDAPLPPSK